MTIPAHVEMVLYHALDATGLLEVSITSSAGPWEELWLTEPRPLGEALTEWAALAAVAFPGESFAFDWPDSGDAATVRFASPSTDIWLRMHPTLAELCGMSTTVVGGTQAINNDLPLRAAIAPAALGRTQPRTVEDDELEEFRMGRAAAHHYNRRREVGLEVFIAEDEVEGLLGYPILSGHCALYATMMDDAVDPDTGEPYGEDNLGGRLLIYPVDTPSIESVEGSGGEVVVTVVGTIEGG